MSIFQETRTRILLLYALLLLAAVGVTIPILRSMLFAEVDSRVRADMLEDMESFLAEYRAAQQRQPFTASTLETFLDDFLSQTLPEDDSFFVALIDGEIYSASPAVLPAVIGQSSSFILQWQQVQRYTQAEINSSNPAVGQIAYVVQPLMAAGQLRGQFVIVHLSAGERQEALSVFYIFAKAALILVVSAFGMAWLATGRLLRPVKDLAKAARTINEADLSGRIEVSGSGELTELAMTFNAMMNRIQQAFKSQRMFINDAGHELRTPITIIQGHLELMGDDPHEQAETLAIVMDELSRMNRLVDELLLLARSERPDFLKLERVDAIALSQDIFTKAKTLADRDWQLCLDTSSALAGRGHLFADPQRLTGALLNLLNNAAQHTHAGDRIELGCRPQVDRVIFWVKDTGEGIPEDDQLRIFQRFARVQQTQRQSDGAGLGLAIVQAICEAHQGKVSVSSQPGIGSTFILTIPTEPLDRISGKRSQKLSQQKTLSQNTLPQNTLQKAKF
jgi:signal transduction histidine kinase